jgi:DNA-binding NarL/FixJ family response regulator
MTPRDTVLVVDDSPGTLGLLNDVLESAGYTVLVAQSGAAALTAVAGVTPDAILMDAVMPGLDGFETCRLLRRDQALAAVPIIFMTGLTETEHVLRALEAGGVDYVTKPVSPDEVVARIGVHVANARRTRGAQAALDAAGRFLLAIDRQGRVLWWTPQAATLLAKHGCGEGVLPEALWRGIVGRGHDAPGALLSSEATSNGPALAGAPELQLVGQLGSDELLLRVVPASVASAETRVSVSLSVTPREAEVLLWMSRGKADRDIAEILGLSPRTVSKHLEQAYVKLGVENRAAATALVVRALDVGARETP